MSFRVVGLSNATLDMAFQIDSFPILPNQHQFVDGRLITAGGMANTFFVGSRLGMAMEAIGYIGGDNLGKMWQAEVIDEGIRVDRQIVFPDQPTTLSIALVDPDGEHLFIGHRGDLKMAADGFPDPWRQAIHDADALMLYGWSYLSMGPEANLIALEIAKAANVPVFFDPGPEIPHMPAGWLEAMYAGSTVVLLTEDEAKMSLPAAQSREELAQQILNFGPELVILKLGAEGMMGHTATQTDFQPGLSVEVVDLTGAGDSVLAAVVLSYLQKHPMAKMLALANATGAACVKKFGSGVNVPTLAEISAVLDQSDSPYAFS